MKNSLRILASYLIAISAIFMLLSTATYAQQQKTILEGDSSVKKIGIGTEQTPLTLAECQENGNCSIEHILLLANSIIKWAVAISGSVALLMYIIGGVWMIFSQGNSSRIERGKDIIVGTSVSLIFILGGWLIIQFALESLNAKDQYQLAPNNCGTSGQCPNGQFCDNNKCVEKCAYEKAKSDPNHQWQCQPMESCNITSRPACENSANCVVNYCLTQPENIVCCYRP